MIYQVYFRKQVLVYMVWTRFMALWKHHSHTVQARCHFDWNMPQTLYWCTQVLWPPPSSLFFIALLKESTRRGRIAGCHCFLATALALPVHLPDWRLREIAVFHNRLGRSGPTHNECCCNFCCHGGNGCPSAFFFFLCLLVHARGAIYIETLM